MCMKRQLRQWHGAASLTEAFNLAGASSTNPQDFATYKAADDASRLGERRRSSDAAPMDWTSPSVDQMMANLMQSLKQLAP